ncbi:type IX secretion system plug protein [Flavobacterium psychrophilum]|uniref:type IX secretion system plug protein n=1 Tax=Flavobacterium psychrophilum TaxID=96345 RepID=UPI000B7C4894|nr:DUF5103 domain-containing protein [Flavobacterium psychrophilum]MCB5983982.1 DUF5103 domain-containing protein [Flavobacterium psychrophilum]MCB5994557.1 DUF5103 domain-containing protein [Flavobacterium psychrophilum]MCB5996696.1 DUF5103 domain-containing protein [Flavobacterium psychrophilum]MCB6004116.1 DUF5103 domain-containing protein [Flavobacterium psychrophilum]MCB6006581.1 DUF5103 domain-containing protein [Flavobacterium psychrophilum]
MAKRVFLLFIAILLMNSVIGQTISETIPPFNIKTVTFTQNTNNVIPVFKLGEPFQLSFDDLFGTEEDYYYTIAQYNYNWTPTLLSKNEYLNGNDNQRIQDYENSFNTLQIYSHYRLNFPNNYTQITKSGNYLVSIFSSNKEIIFTKKIIIYEELVDVPMQVKRARNVTDNKYKHNLEFSIKSNSILFQNPVQNVKIILLQNGKWDNAIVNIKPQYTIGNDLIFKYDKETQFFAGNEYLYFDNKEIRVATNTIAKVNSNTGLYNSHLYTDSARKYKSYSYYPDINGNFKIRNLTAQNNDIEADYSWIYFTLFAINAPASTNIYITGMFNNNTISPENKMDYNTNKGVFEKAILIKQGFTNYNYTILDPQNNISDKDPIDGNFYETENQYTAIVYYRQNGELYDRVIGKGNANSTNITN